ncbi:hypothetical protein LTS18_003517, partial [Coniosporium uncinatum]
ETTINGYDALVSETREQSLIGIWSGDDMTKWLQHFMRNCKRIVWITRRTKASPLNDLAGILLRTMQSEQPSLDVTWLAAELGESEEMLQEATLSVLQGTFGDEGYYELKNGRWCVKRWVPDDELSALTGVAVPQLIQDPTIDDDKDYSLVKEGAGEVQLIYSNTPLIHLPSKENVVIEVEASVFDVSRVSSSGHFFSGTVIHPSGTFEAGTLVVGWSPQSPSRFVEISPKRITRSPHGLTACDTAAHFALRYTSIAAIVGFCRAREGDRFRINADGALGRMLEAMARDCRSTIVAPEDSSEVTFSIYYSPDAGLTINGRPLDIGDYVCSNAASLAVCWELDIKPDNLGQLRMFELPDFKAAADHAYRSEPISTVLCHKGQLRVVDAVATHKRAGRMFSADCVYVVIGGFGGLGRFVCSWMVEYGVKKLAIISRSGMRPAAAQETFRLLAEAGADVEVVEADASNKQALTQALSSIRKQGTIKGIINMAMVLGDAPLASMTGEQWDRAVRIKIDSSLILHEETLNDNLDMFISFSSIASVLGNRSQAGYNVGNQLLNALAEHRRSLNLPAVSIALGAMIDIGVMHESGVDKEQLLSTLMRSGLTHLQKHHLAKIMEAAVRESYNKQSKRAVILTGLEMFERVDGKSKGQQDQTMLYWTELPEFGHLQTHTRSWSETPNTQAETSLLDVARSSEPGEARKVILDAFLKFLAGLLGFDAAVFNPASSLSMYGLDSLSGVSCQYWFHRELEVDTSVPEILGASSIDGIVNGIVAKVLRAEATL